MMSNDNNHPYAVLLNIQLLSTNISHVKVLLPYRCSSDLVLSSLKAGTHNHTVQTLRHLRTVRS